MASESIMTDKSDVPSADAAVRPAFSETRLPEISEIGLTVLWPPKDDSKVIADVCFVHGLGGHPRKTWQHGSGKPEKKKLLSRLTSRNNGPRAGDTSGSCYWPFDLLPRDFDNIRILTYGYDSSPSHWYKGKTT